MFLYEFNKKTLFILLNCIILCAADHCSKPADCNFKNAVCRSRTCSCQNGFVLSSNQAECLPKSDGYLSNCTDSVQCSSILFNGGTCLRGICECTDGFHYFKGRCWKTSGLNEGCAHNENCLVNFDFEASQCAGGKCVCSSGYYQREYSSCRPESHHVGDPCVINLDCKFDKGFCRTNHTCGTVGELDSPVILPVKIIGNPFRNLSTNYVSKKCSSNRECMTNSICLHNKCICSPGYFTNDGVQCHPEIGSPCSGSKDCVGKFMTCDEKKKICVCQIGFIAEDGNQNCTKLSRQLGWSCLEDRWCSVFGPGGICVNNSCMCSNDTHYVSEEMYCWTSKAVGDSCKADLDCGSDKSAEKCSKDGKCSCNQGYHPSEDHTACHADSKHIDDVCTDDVDCMYPNAMCDSKSGKCSCSSGYMVKDNACVSGAGGKCSSDNECSASGSHCNGSICICSQAFVSSSNYSMCLAIAKKYESGCIETQQCTPVLGPNSFCDSGKCHCSKGFHNIGNYCYADIQLYANCSATAECQVKNSYSECRKGLCQCKFENPPDAFNATCTGNGAKLSYNSFFLILTLFIVLIKHFN